MKSNYQIMTDLGPAYPVVIVDPVTGLPTDTTNINDIQTATPSSGETVIMTQNKRNGTLIIDGTGALTSLTIDFPHDDVSANGQIRRVVTMRPINNLIASGSNVLNFPSSMDTNDAVQFQKITATNWVQIG